MKTDPSKTFVFLRFFDVFSICMPLSKHIMFCSYFVSFGLQNRSENKEKWTELGPRAQVGTDFPVKLVTETKKISWDASGDDISASKDNQEGNLGGPRKPTKGL